jgi:hypothetical protein
MNIHHGLGGGLHPHQPVRQHQPIAISQPAGLREIEQDIPPACGYQTHAAAMPLIEIQQDRVDFLRRWPFARRTHILHERAQNRKYRCAIGNTVAGAQVSSTPSARTS